MAFGQAAGPPAPQREVDALAALLEAKGFDSFKEARHPFGLTQRQAAGKFTATEVAELVERLEADAEGEAGEGPAPRTLGSAKADERAAQKRRAREEEVATKIESAVLATELENRGWCVIPPPEV